MDADDIAAPNLIEVMKQKADADNADVVVCANYITQSDKVDAGSTFSTLEGQGIVRPLDAAILQITPLSQGNNKAKSIKALRLCTFKLPPEPWCKLVKRSFLVDNKIYFPDVPVEQDLCWTVQIAMHTSSISFIEEPLYHYIQMPNTVSSGKFPFSMFQMVDFCVPYLKQRGYYKQLRYDLIVLALKGFLHLWQRIKPEIKDQFIEHFLNMCQQLDMRIDPDSTQGIVALQHKIYKLIPPVGTNPFGIRARLRYLYHQDQWLVTMTQKVLAEYYAEKKGHTQKTEHASYRHN